MSKNEVNDVTKRAHITMHYSDEEIELLEASMADPLFFIENFIKIQHPTKGSIPFEMYDFQKEMIRTFSDNKKIVALCARQMGKCVEQDSNITINDRNVKVGSLIEPTLTFREKLVSKLERLLVKLATS